MAIIRRKDTNTNVSYDPTRELYEAYNQLFHDHYLEETGIDVTIEQSHGGSGGQSRSVVEDAAADVVTLALEHDITAIEEAGLIEPGWIDEFDPDSSPYVSSIVLIVRAGNPKVSENLPALDAPSPGAASMASVVPSHCADLAG